MSDPVLRLRTGIGYDVHRLVEGRELYLGGKRIEYPLGLLGHSDADVLLHAIMDSLLGASGMGDIGQLFPDNDQLYKNISSLLLLQKVGKKLLESGIEILSIDSVVICEAPKLKPYISDIKNNISGALNNLDLDRINLKGTTTEKLGFTGRGEGIASEAVSLILLPLKKI